MDSSSFLKIVSDNNKNKNYDIVENRNIQINTLDELLINEKISHQFLLKLMFRGMS